MRFVQTRLGCVAIALMILGCAVLASDRLQEPRTTKNEAVAERGFTVVTQPAEFRAFLVKDPNDKGFMVKPRHVRAYSETTVEWRDARNALRTEKRASGAEVFPTDVIKDGAAFNHSDVIAVFVLADGSEVQVPAGEGIVVTEGNTADGGMSCTECAGLAVSTCNAGCVASVECGGSPSGSCKFTCKNPCPSAQ